MGSELLRIADGFSMVAEGLRGLAKMECVSDTAEKNIVQEQADTEKTKKPDKKNTEDNKKEKTVTVEDIRAVMAQKSQEGKTKEIRELLQKFGAVKLSAVKPEDYPALLQEAKVL
ncbi:hypothetical protein [Enterocloster clostridioformis]|uniref:hypothetical protein n=1 Tax=Enterocloster clostridioformis TaxID=1531 RepID=UPI0022E814C7|nr:hypothetical protein [Enterocloster clostridioformis]